ncbi:ferric-dicitrate binding protein FerR (iron transport regulator) [Pedobacter sp. AK013]|uniref:FecR family protein n=1 Tax=Pedobacter sp. AK013 TaxID=2723071 RepID=UPI00161BC3A5|nr:FecR family protein [Pedobacter sp. AK013]MBB6237068.1 ferric-dicitrate binding protein FerR (iron transport regulator) [Pedobacter sp. AK013]
MTENQRLNLLFNRQLQHLNSTEEKEEFLLLMADPCNKEQVKRLLKSYWEAFDENQFSPAAFLFGDGGEILSKIQSENIYPLTQPQRRPKRWIGIAAALAIIIFGASLFYLKRSTDLASLADTNTHITPGSTGATLKLANGKTIKLSDAVNGELASEAGVTITKTKNGLLIYEIKGTTLPDQINTLSTNNGETYQVRLPDGSLVWLNAASSLSYNTALVHSGKRSVNLVGEAYFEIAKDKKHPFIVKTGTQEVEVLGTHFNVNAYADESTTKTTLLEGSVKIKNKTDQKIIVPGEQATVNKDNISVDKVNTEYAIAWKNGVFRFTDKTLEAGMLEVARWYNVQVIYKRPELKNELLGGRISKYANINQVLKKMELAKAFKFTVKGREIIVE